MTAPTQPPAVAAPAAGRFEWHTFGAGTPNARRYKLYVPAAYDARRPAPLVVFLHGCTQDPDDLARGTRMNEAADRAGALVAYPEQPATANALKCWRWFESAQQHADGEELGAIAGITREVMRTHAIDARRVHVAGISAGAAMALMVAAANPSLYASVASHSGVPIGAAGTVADGWTVMKSGLADSVDLGARFRAFAGTPSRVVPLLVVHGAADNVVSVRNGRQTAAQWAAAFAPSATATEAERLTDGGRAVERTTFRRAGSAAPLVELRIVDGLAHAWSGGSRAGTFTDEGGPSATALVLAFFAQHPREAQ